MLHELTHAIMDDSPSGDSARRAIASHFTKRTRGETPIIKRGRRYLRDHWHVLEAGLEDGGELASYYGEMLGYPPPQLAQLLQDKHHRETFELVLSALGINHLNQ